MVTAVQQCRRIQGEVKKRDEEPLQAAHTFSVSVSQGYQSIVGFFPELNISLALATNIETDKQDRVWKHLHALPGL